MKTRKFSGMDASLIGRLKELERERENVRLKRMYTDALLDADILKEAMAKTW